jgi:isopropylmalate/homocitrate/citramalate synthase
MTIKDLLLEYARLLNEFGVDSTEATEFLERNGDNDAFRELTELARKLKRKLSKTHGSG